MLYELLAHPEVSDDLGEFLFNYFGDKKKIYIPKTIPDKDFETFTELCCLGLTIFECVKNKRGRLLAFKDNGAFVLLTKNGKFEIKLYKYGLDLCKQDLKIFLRIEADAKNLKL